MSVFNKVKRSSAQVEENLAAARDAVKKATKASATGFFKRSVDWEEVAACYRTAVKHFEQTGDAAPEEHLRALLAAAQAHLRLHSFHSAGKDLVAAAKLLSALEDDRLRQTLAAKVSMAGGEPATESNLLAEAGTLLLQGGQTEPAANTFMMAAAAAAAAAQPEPERALKLASEACKIFEDHVDRAHFCDQTFKAALSLGARLERWDWMRTILERQIPLCLQSKNGLLLPEIKKLMLSILVIRYHLKQWKEAQEDLRRFNTTGDFASSEHSEAGFRLLTVHQERDPETQLRALVAQPSFIYLSAPIAGLARRLRLTPEDLLLLQEVKAGEDAFGAVLRMEDLLGPDVELDADAELEAEFGESAAAGDNGSPKELPEQEEVEAKEEEEQDLEAMLAGLQSLGVADADVDPEAKVDELPGPVVADVDRDAQAGPPQSQQQQEDDELDLA